MEKNFCRTYGAKSLNEALTPACQPGLTSFAPPALGPAGSVSLDVWRGASSTDWLRQSEKRGLQYEHNGFRM